MNFQHQKEKFQNENNIALSRRKRTKLAHNESVAYLGTRAYRGVGPDVPALAT